MEPQSRTVLGVKHPRELLPRLVRNHGVLEDARRVNEANEVRGVLRHPRVYCLLRAHVQLGLLNLDPHLASPALDVLPPLHVQVAHLRRPRQELKLELRSVLALSESLLLLRPIEKPLAHDQAQRTVAARDANNAFFWHLELALGLFVAGRHVLSPDVPTRWPSSIAAVLDGRGRAQLHVIEAEGRLPEELRRHIGDDVPVICALDVNQLNGELVLLAKGVAVTVQARA
mmetsp:Transcript_72632/g.155562  ORF Transcript_72632/g.155562 Transcript_72632/m.155562 type:complete len:229 (+) Transcript_72632:682-1368(+)